MPKTEESMISKLESHLTAANLFARGQKILIACSGGADSVSLCHLLHGLGRAWSLRLGLLHFNHRLRPKEALRDERFVRALGKALKIPVTVGRGNIRALAKREKFSAEEAARTARYQFFVKTAKRQKAAAITTAHTQDDQAETVLMRLIQGTGLRGLCGIRESFSQQGVRFIRPLLHVSRRDLRAFLSENRLRFCVDTSNRSLRYVRNRIRRKLLPVLARDFNPRIVEALARIAAIAAEETEVLSEVEEASWRRIQGRRRPGKIHFRRSVFLKLPSALQFRLLERGLKALDAKSGINFERWTWIRRGMAQGAVRCSLPGGVDFRLSASEISICRKNGSK